MASSRKRTLSVAGNPWSDDATRKRHRLPQTCEWIREEPAYQAWKSWNESDPPVLWIQGSVGIGKTFLADFIANDVEGVSVGSTVLTAYCSAQSTPVWLARNFASQLVHSAQVGDAARTKASSLERNSPTDAAPVPYDASYRVWDELTSVIEDSPRLTLIVDGLDELAHDFLSHQGFDLASKLADLTTILAGNVRLLVLSRPQPSILRALRDSPTIQVTTAKVAEDIKRFCVSEVVKYPQLEIASEDVSAIVARKSEGIFVWASLAIRVLAEQADQGGVRLQLDRLPNSLDDLYRETFEKQSEYLTDTNIMLRDVILRWLVLSVRPMAVAEAANAISFETNMFITDLEATAVEVCGSLVKFEDGCLKVVHHSLRDFLSGQYSGGTKARTSSSGEENLKITKCLLEYLMRPGFQHAADLSSPQDFRKLYPLAEYASLYWVHHLSMSKADDDLRDQIVLFFKTTNANVWITTLLPAFLASSVLSIPPRPPINARFFYISMLKSQVVNYFEPNSREALKLRLNAWLESVYEDLFSQIRDDIVTTAEYLQQWIELVELYSWLPQRGSEVTPQLREAIELFCQSEGPGCRDLITTARQALADDLKRNGEYAEAQKVLEDLVRDVADTSSSGRLALSFAHDSLGWVLSRQGKLDRAATHLQKALDLFTAYFGSRSPYTLRSRLTLAEVLVKTGRHGEAETLYGALEKQLLERADGDDARTDMSKDTVAHLNTLAGIYRLQGKYAEARDTFRVVVEERKQMFGADSRLTLWAEMQYGMVAREAGDVQLAEGILSGLLPRQVEALGSEHQDVRDVTRALRDMRETKQ